MRTLLRNKHYDHEPVWHVQVAMLCAIALQLRVPDHYIFASRYVLVVVELLLLAALSFTTNKDPLLRSLSRRINVLLLLGLSGIANGYALVIVAQNLLSTSAISNGRALILTALNIYITNVIIFGLAYWEMDAGGPDMRFYPDNDEPDFLFPQNQQQGYKHPGWRPTFVDYLYVSSTNAMAFSPTDTLPLTRRAKLLMLTQALLALVSVGLVLARAVNIL